MTTGSYTIGSSSTALYAQKTWSGSNDPAHKAWNAYTCSAVRVEKGLSQRYDRATGVLVDQVFVHDTTRWCPSTSDFTSNDQLDLLSKIAETARGHSFNAAVFTAEIGQTAGLLGDRSSAFLQGLRHAIKGNYSKALRTWVVKRPKGSMKFKDVSDFLLETRYGWQPLLSDIYEIGKALSTMTADPRRMHFTVRKTVRVSRDTSTSPTQYSVPAVGTFTRKYKCVFTEELSTARALGLTNPATVLWEKLPWSFVIDWFIPIGTYLDVLGTIPFMRGTLGQTDFSRATGRNSAVRKSTATIEIVGGFVNYTAIKMTRYALSTPSRVTLPMPSLKALDKAFSLTHIQNAAALVWSGIASTKR